MIAYSFLYAAHLFWNSGYIRKQWKMSADLLAPLNCLFCQMARLKSQRCLVKYDKENKIVTNHCRWQSGTNECLPLLVRKWFLELQRPSVWFHCMSAGLVHRLCNTISSLRISWHIYRCLQMWQKIKSACHTNVLVRLWQNEVTPRTPAHIGTVR